ncbi:MAG: lytic transglycosylase domain-containing protein [Clostridiaceae bacterium]
MKKRNEQVKKKKHIMRTLLVMMMLLGVGILYLRVFPLEYVGIIDKYSNEFGVDNHLIYAVIHTESRFDSEALSPAGAVGLMQVTEETGQFIAKKLEIADFKVEDLQDPETNIKMGTYYLSYLQTMFEREETVLAAYNAGPNRVKTWLLDPAYATGDVLTNIPFKETKDYVDRVLLREKIYKILYFFK